MARKLGGKLTIINIVQSSEKESSLIQQRLQLLHKHKKAALEVSEERVMSLTCACKVLPTVGAMVLVSPSDPREVCLHFLADEQPDLVCVGMLDCCTSIIQRCCSGPRSTASAFERVVLGTFTSARFCCLLSKRVAIRSFLLTHSPASVLVVRHQ